LEEWTTPDFQNTPSTTKLKGEEIVDTLGNDGNMSMPEQVIRPNAWRKMMMMMMMMMMMKMLGQVQKRARSAICIPNVTKFKTVVINPLNAELNPICHLLALLGVHHFLHVSRIRVKSLTLRLLMSYIYIYIWSTYSWCF
jgi:hypothetical protein